jgi:hypothetical protein
MTTYARFFSLFRDAKRDPHFPYETHGEVVLEFTKGGTDSLRKLTEVELRRLERNLEELIHDPRKASGQRQRRKIIAILADRGCTTADGKPDMPHIHAWVLRYGYLHKHLNAYSLQELPRLVTQAEAIVASDIKAVRNV